MRLTWAAASYFKKYVQSEIAKATGVTVRKPFQRPREIRKRQWVFTEDRPWTAAAKEANAPNKNSQPVFVEPIPESQWKIFKGDRVEVLVGKDKGKQGIVNGVIKERNWCFVEGLNCQYRWVDRSPTNPGTVMKLEKPLLTTTEVALVDPSTLKATPVEWRHTEEGERVRVSAHTGRIIPKPKSAEDELEDFVNVSTYVETDKDTKAEAVHRITFEPKLTSFEEDIKKQMNVADPRPRADTLWY